MLFIAAVYFSLVYSIDYICYTITASESGKKKIMLSYSNKIKSIFYTIILFLFLSVLKL